VKRVSALALGIAVTAVGSGLSGCVGGTAATSLQVTAASSPITKAQATAYARAVNLQPVDLPGMQVASPEMESPPPMRLGREEERCVGDVGPDLLVARIRSATFTGTVAPEHEQIRSAIEVMPTAALAARNYAANASQRAISCTARFLPRLLAKSSRARVRYGHFTVTRLPNPMPGVNGSFGFRVEATILGVPAALEPTPPHLYVDAFGFLAGAAEVNLIATAFPQPVSEEVEARLLSLLYARAGAHKL
jgi:hypothetical protein